MTGLWSGQRFSYQGQHYHLQELIFLPRPIQLRISIWVGGNWPNKPPMRRAAHLDGAFPIGRDGPLTPDDWRAIKAYIQQHRRNDAPLELVHAGLTSGTDRAADATIVGPYTDPGVTWWIEGVEPWRFGQNWEEQWSSHYSERMRERIRSGPLDCNRCLGHNKSGGTPSRPAAPWYVAELRSPCRPCHPCRPCRRRLALPELPSQEYP